MSSSRFGGLLVVTGVVVGVAAVVGLATGFEPSRLPAALLDIAVYKLTFVAAAGLLAAGAILRRYARRDDRTDAERSVGVGSGPAARPALSSSADAEILRHSEARPKAEVPK